MQKIGDIPNTRADNNGEFTDGNVAGGIPPTILPAEWFNTIQRELMSILNAAEIEADSDAFDQVLLAIQKLVSEEIPEIKDGSLTQKGVVQLSSSTTSVSEIFAATPKAVKDMGDNALKTTNNLSEIAAAGSVAQATTQANIGLTPSKFSGRLLNTQTFTSTGTYTPTAGTGYIIVEAVGGGGASGAISATSASQNAITSVGSPGAYAKVLYTSVPSTASVVIGSGGVGILGAGPTGGGTTFGSILTCPGGPGSVVGNAHIPPGGSTGQGGALSPTVSGGGQIITSAFGQQNNPSVTIAPGVGTNYVSIEKTLLGNYGAGGQGQFIGISQVQKIGLNGTNGYLIVWEYS
ncbi:tail fiber protein [Yersinia enterocolitica]|uniref:tail fiber protein n=1 Tax=Yersinia enterocolitica TaxID=630 RepID=UPI0005EA2B08|nr:phage tail protein [Yersinia enterocolitica]CQJ66487.1 tail fiber repeat 2-containing protein [Yersinia enterocolitica]